MKKIFTYNRHKIITSHVLVDDNLYENLNISKWFLNCNGYAMTWKKIRGKRKKIFMHRLIMNTPNGLYTDHINHNIRDNRLKNLRIVTKQQNCLNRKKPGKNVSWHKIYKMWHVQLTRHGKPIYIGRYNTKKEAIMEMKKVKFKYDKI